MVIMVFIQGILNILKVKNDNNVGLVNIFKLLLVIMFNVVITCSRLISPSSIDTDNIQFILPRKG